MTISSLELQAATAQQFFAALDANGVRYALLRNYEEFPHFGHDADLIVAIDDIPQWRTAAIACAKQLQWTVLTECHHWNRSYFDSHTIQILRFYSEPLGCYLQIDAFHSLLVNGLPFFDERLLIESRIRDSRGFYRIHPRIENLFRLNQIAKQIAFHDRTGKIERYRSRFLAYLADDPEFIHGAEQLHYPNIKDAIVLLEQRSYPQFCDEIERHKRRWLKSTALSKPISTSALLVQRAWDNHILHRFRACGFVIRVNCSLHSSRTIVREALDELVGRNFVPSYTDEHAKVARVLERGGIVVKWIENEQADIIVYEYSGVNFIYSQILNLIIDRHPRLVDCRK